MPFRSSTIIAGVVKPSTESSDAVPRTKTFKRVATQRLKDSDGSKSLERADTTKVKRKTKGGEEKSTKPKQSQVILAKGIYDLIRIILDASTQTGDGTSSEGTNYCFSLIYFVCLLVNVALASKDPSPIFEQLAQNSSIVRAVKIAARVMRNTNQPNDILNQAIAVFQKFAPDEDSSSGSTSTEVRRAKSALLDLAQLEHGDSVVVPKRNYTSEDSDTESSDSYEITGRSIPSLPPLLEHPD